jgi:hypothetical protein
MKRIGSAIALALALSVLYLIVLGLIELTKLVF